MRDVPDVIRRLDADGFQIVIVSNESLDRFKSPQVIRERVERKTRRIEQWAAAVAPVRVLALVATSKVTDLDNVARRANRLPALATHRPAAS